MSYRVRFITAAAVLSFLALPATTQAQTAFLWAGGGVTFPTGDYSDATDTGWLGTAGIGVNIGGSGAAVFGEGIYGQNSFAGTADGNAKLFGAMGGLIYRAGDPANVGPYGFVGGGLLVVDPSDGDSESNFGYEVGIGLDVPTSGNVGFWFEVRYMGSTGSDTVDANIFGILAGIGVGLG